MKSCHQDTHDGRISRGRDPAGVGDHRHERHYRDESESRTVIEDRSVANPIPQNPGNETKVRLIMLAPLFTLIRTHPCGGSGVSWGLAT